MNLVPGPGCDWDRTRHKPAAARSSHKVHLCQVGPMPRHRRYQPAPTSSPTRHRRRCHASARLRDIRLTSADPAANLSSRFAWHFHRGLHLRRTASEAAVKNSSSRTERAAVPIEYFDAQRAPLNLSLSKISSCLTTNRHEKMASQAGREQGSRPCE